MNRPSVPIALFAATVWWVALWASCLGDSVRYQDGERLTPAPASRPTARTAPAPRPVPRPKPATARRSKPSLPSFLLPVPFPATPPPLKASTRPLLDYRTGQWGHNHFYSEGVQVFTWGSVCFKYSVSLFNPARFRKGRSRLTPRARKDFAEVAGYAVDLVIKHKKNKTIWVHGYASPDEASTRAKAVRLSARRAKAAAAIVRRAARGRITVQTVAEGFPIPLAVWPSKYEHRFRSVLLSIGQPMFLAYGAYPKMPPSRVKALQTRVHRRHHSLDKGRTYPIDGVGLHFPVRHITVSTPKGPLKLRLHSTRYNPDEKYLHQYFSRWLKRCKTRKKPGT